MALGGQQLGRFASLDCGVTGVFVNRSRDRLVNHYRGNFIDFWSLADRVFDFSAAICAVVYACRHQVIHLIFASHKK